MRQTSDRMVLSLAVVALIGGPLFSLVAAPRMARLPVDFRQRQVSEGYGTYLDEDGGFQVVGPVRLRNVHDVRGMPESSRSDVAVWAVHDRFLDLETGRQLDSTRERYAMDRTTARTVSCCGADQDRRGALAQAFPVGTRATSYPWWDGSALRPFVARFVREEAIGGVKLFRFRVAVSPLVIDRVALPAEALGRSSSAEVELDWWYRSVTDLWVEPATGVIVKGSQEADQWLANGNGARRLTVATTRLVDTPETVAQNLASAADRRDALVAQRVWPYVLGPLLAVLLVALGSVRQASPVRT